MIAYCNVTEADKRHTKTSLVTFTKKCLGGG